MDIGSIFVLLGLVVLVALYILRPFIEQPIAGARKQRGAALLAADQQEHQLSALLAERDQVLNTLQELDFDHLLGKIPEEDYPLQRAAFVQRGAAILRKLDDLQASAAGSAPCDKVEAAIAARRVKQAPQPIVDNSPPMVNSAPASEDTLEAMIAMRRRKRQGKTGGFCPKCGRPVQQGDRFCHNCGTPLA
ncbi:MAG: zinc-ribbon domain-containing protein [Anaerolineales bacterium]|nr:zinc-ribbon domain-containing protein [Anaerolineales bacterium]